MVLQGPVSFGDQGIRNLNELIIFQFRNVVDGECFIFFYPSSMLILGNSSCSP